MLRTACIEKLLQHELCRYHVNALRTLLLGQACIEQETFGVGGGESLVPEEDLQASELMKPGAVRPGFSSFLSFGPGCSGREAHDDGGYPFFSNELPKQLAV